MRASLSFWSPPNTLSGNSAGFGEPELGAESYRVYENSLLFVAGDYPDKGIEVTEADLARMVRATPPLCLNLEHAKEGAFSALVCNVGFIRRMWIDPEDPRVVRGEVALPRWLDESLEKKGISMEVPFDKKRFIGAALTYTPRISEAALMRAVSARLFAQRTYWGRYILQSVHDIVASAGAVCVLPEEAGESEGRTLSFIAETERAAFQQVHDICVANGACCLWEDSDGAEMKTRVSSEKGNAYMNSAFNTLQNLRQQLTQPFKRDADSAAPQDRDPQPDAPAPCCEQEERCNPDAKPSPIVFSEEVLQSLFTEVLDPLKAEMEALKKEREQKQAELEAAFSEENARVIDRLIAERRIPPSAREQHLKDRAANPALYDRLSVHFHALPGVDNLLDAAKVYERLQSDPDQEARVAATMRYLQEQIGYQPW